VKPPLPAFSLFKKSVSAAQVAFSCFIPIYVINFTGNAVAGPILSLGFKQFKPGMPVISALASDGKK